MGRFGKKRCNAPRATDFREKRNPLQADSIQWWRRFEFLFAVFTLSRKHPRAIFINYWIKERWSFLIHDRSRCLHHCSLVTPSPGFNRCCTRFHCSLASPLNFVCLPLVSLRPFLAAPWLSPCISFANSCCCRLLPSLWLPYFRWLLSCRIGPNALLYLSLLPLVGRRPMPSSLCGWLLSCRIGPTTLLSSFLSLPDALLSCCCCLPCHGAADFIVEPSLS